MTKGTLTSSTGQGGPPTCTGEALLGAVRRQQQGSRHGAAFSPRICLVGVTGFSFLILGLKGLRPGVYEMMEDLFGCICGLSDPLSWGGGPGEGGAELAHTERLAVQLRMENAF